MLSGLVRPMDDLLLIRVGFNANVTSEKCNLSLSYSKSKKFMRQLQNCLMDVMEIQ